MKVSIQDIDALAAISPDALLAYARAAGWEKLERYRKHSEVYVHEVAPEIIIPMTQCLGDYANVVSQLIQIFAKVAESDELSVYRDLITADCDVVRIKAASEGFSGSVTLKDGVSLIAGAYEMVFAVACSLCEPRPLWRERATKEVDDFMRRVHLGHTEHGSFVVTLMAPVDPPRQSPAAADGDVPIERRVTQRLVDALAAARAAAERVSAGDADAFLETAQRGADAKLCSAVAKLIKPFGGIDIGLTWARTWPKKTAKETVRFKASDAPILRNAARSFRNREHRKAVPIVGYIQRLSRNESTKNGKVTLRTKLDEHPASVESILNQQDYERAVQAHLDNAHVVMTGDIKRSGNRWRLSNPNIVNVFSDEDKDRDLLASARQPLDFGMGSQR